MANRIQGSPWFNDDETPVVVDTFDSVIIDYDVEGFSAFSGIIDEIRPVTDGQLRDAGVAIPDDALPIRDLWLGRATGLFGILDRERKMVVYFALHFDRTTLAPL